jgi:outer membrane biosynthesis protein TonB
MSDKTKRRIAIAGASVICLALVVAIGMQFAKEPAKPDASLQEPVSSSDAAPDIQDNTEKKEVVVSPQTTPEPESSETLPPQTDLPEQKLQPDPVKPAAPAKPELPKDADTTIPSKPPEYKPEDTEKKPAAESKPQGGGGLPGFNNVPDGGANQVIEGKSDGDINKQVGEMN